MPRPVPGAQNGKEEEGKVAAFKERIRWGRQTHEQAALRQSAKCCEGSAHVGSSGIRLPRRG